MNDTIKRKIKESRIMQYEIAAKIGISEYTFCRWFRKELTAEQQAQWRQKLTGRMGAALQDHFRADPASYERAVKAVGVR